MKNKSKSKNKNGHLKEVVVAVSILVAAAIMFGLFELCKYKQEQKVENAGKMEVCQYVDELFADCYRVPVQYSETSYMVYSLNSNGEQHAESVDTNSSGGDAIAKVYTKDDNVICLNNDGEVTFGPEYSPIRFIKAVAEYSIGVGSGIEFEAVNAHEYLVSDNHVIGQMSEEDASQIYGVDTEAKVYTFKIPDIEHYKKVYAQLSDEAAQATADSMLELQGDSEVDFVLTVSPGEPREFLDEFEAYLHYTVDGETYLGWYIGGCSPLNSWELPEEWYTSIEELGADRVYEMYSELVNILNRAVPEDSGYLGELGTTIEEFEKLSEDEQTALLKGVEDTIKELGYSYNDGAGLELWRQTILEDISALEDKSDDLTEVVLLIGVSRGILVVGDSIED